MKGFEKVFTDYEINGLVMMSEGNPENAIKVLGKDIIAVRGDLRTKEKEFRIDYNDNYFVFPGATKGFGSNEGEWLDVKSVLAVYGMLSHTFDVNNLITAKEETAGWDTDKVFLEKFEKDILQKTDFLYPVTLSETGYIVKSYLGLDYAYDMEEKEIHLYADNFVPGQAFYVRTKGEIQKAEGAGFEKVCDGYYMVRLKSPEAVLVLV